MNFLIFFFNGHRLLEASAASVKHYQIVTFDILAGEAGFDPTSTVLETAELPLFYSPMKVRLPEGNLTIYAELLLYNLDYLSSTYSTATFTDSELKSLVHCHWGNELNVDLNVVARHNHFLVSWESDLTGNIQGTDEELRTVVVVEWSVTSTLFFLEDVDLCYELGVRSD